MTGELEILQFLLRSTGKLCTSRPNMTRGRLVCPVLKVKSMLIPESGKVLARLGDDQGQGDLVWVGFANLDSAAGM